MRILTVTLNYFKEVKQEMLRVTWPSRQTVINHTLIVLGALIVIMLVIAAFDDGLIFLLKSLILKE